MSTREEFREALELTRHAFAEMRDTAKLKAHLFRMEVRDTAPKVDAFLTDIEENLKRAAQDLEQEGEEARLQAALAAMEARDRWHALESELEPTLRKLKEGGQRLMDESQLDEALKRIESAVAKERRKSEAEQWYERAGKPKEEAPLPEFIDRMKKSAKSFADRLQAL